MDGSRVLVIDDSTTLRKLVEIAMRGTGTEVDFAANGSDGLSRARAHRPDVILLDYLLPDLRSAEVCQQLSNDAATSDVPVVIMSANQRSVLDDFRGFSTVVGFIGKPFTAAEIRSRLEGMVRDSAHAGRARPSTAPGITSGAAPIARAQHTTALPGGLPLTSTSTSGLSLSVSAAGSSSASSDLSTGTAAFTSSLSSSLSSSRILLDGEALQLRGDLICVPLLDVLRLLAAAHATGALVVDDGRARIWLRRGEIVMCVGTAAPPDEPTGLTGELRARIAANLALGKPALVTLAEAGAARATNVPLELHAASAQRIAELIDARVGRFVWEPAVALPDFVEAFGRLVSLTTIALEHARRATFGAHIAAGAGGVLDQRYDRTPRFSDKLAGAKLTSEEQRVLALLDGRTAVRELAGRAKLSPDRLAAIVTRLCAADLIHQEASAPTAARPLAVVSSDGGELVGPLRGRLALRTPPIDVIELDPARPLAEATLEMHPALVLIGVAAVTQRVLEYDLPIIARDSTIAMVCVLEAPHPALAAGMLRAGLHAVIAKPIHVSEIERLLPS